MTWYGWLLVCWVLPVLAQEKPVPTFEEQTRQILRSHLQQAEELKVGELVEELARETRLPREQVQARLAAWLDSMEVWRREKRVEWQRLVQSGGVQTSAKETEKFLRQFAAQARQALEKQSGRPVEELVDEAAKKAQVLTSQGRDLLLRLLSEPADGTPPEKVGLLVEVRSNLKDDRAIWSLLAAGQRPGEATTVAAVLLPGVTGELAGSPRARWAIGQPKAGLQPDWRLVLELAELEYPRTEAGTLRQFLTGQVVLYEMKTGLELYRRPLRVNSHVSEQVDEAGRGPKFAGDIARRTREIFEAYWSTR